MNAATPAQSSDLNFTQLIHQYPDIEQLIASNTELQEQIGALDATAGRTKQIARLHQYSDTLTAITVTALRTTDPVELQRRVGEVVDIFEVALGQLNLKKASWAADDPPPIGQCNPPCQEPTPYCSTNGCSAYPGEQGSFH